ncbi:MAG: hypothetical protein HRT69_13675 [Flavobacteriaceae bacterium]|nr:hypothetical protein [Flavobacteriaceae bacterium]
MILERKILYLKKSGNNDENNYLFSLEFTIETNSISCTVANSKADKSTTFQFNNKKCELDFKDNMGHFVNGTIKVKGNPQDSSDDNYNPFNFSLIYGQNESAAHHFIGIFSLKNLEKEPESVAKVVEKTTEESENSSDTKEVTDTSEGNTESNPETGTDTPKNSPETSNTETITTQDTNTSEGNTESNPETKAELPENSPETSDTVTDTAKDTDVSSTTTNVKTDTEAIENISDTSDTVTEAPKGTDAPKD